MVMAEEKDKTERLAAALRANLARRKAQGKARREEAEHASPAGDDATEVGDPSAPGSAQGDVVPRGKPG